MSRHETHPKPVTRIQKRNTDLILEAALEVFSTHGFRGTTLDQIAAQAGLSKPNLLYYFPSKESIHISLLSGLMETWLDPLRAIDPAGEPLEELMSYVRHKLQMSRDYPRESRLFANEIVQGAPRILSSLKGELRTLVDEKAAMIDVWVADGRIAPLNAHHLIFSIWSLTQHYADFDVQIRAVLGDADPFDAAETFLEQMFTRMLTPAG
ncbi:MAG: TetR family transcriptional regulator C-terminal domain-containing protein [Pseudomonadota bacterium]